MQSDFDCVIVGAGITGAALGLGLAQLGLKIAVLDQVSPTVNPDDDPRGLALAHSSIALLTRLKLWPELASQAYPIHHLHVSQRGHFGALRLSREDLGARMLGAVCPAPTLQRTLLTALANAGVAVGWSTRVLATYPGAECIDVQAEVAGHRERWSTPLLIGADGSDSVVRRLSAIEVDHHAYGQSAIVANLDVETPIPHTAFERFTTSGPLALLPLGARRYVAVRTAATTDAAALVAATPTDYLTDLNRRFGHSLGGFAKLGRRQVYPLVLQRARELHRVRTTLIGNAANTLHPNAAQGLNLGLRDVATLLEILARAQSHGADLGGIELLRDYANARRRDHSLTIRLTDTLARSFSQPGPLGVLRAAALLATDRVAPLKRALLRRVTGFDFSSAG